MRYHLFICLTLLFLAACDDVQDHSLEKYHDEENEDQGNLYHRGIEKRSKLEAILFGASIVLALANVGTDVFFGHGGCCIVHKLEYADACQKVQNAERIQEELLTAGRYIKKQQLKSTSSYNWLLNIDNNNIIISQEIERIRDNIEDIVQAIDPEAKERYAAKSREIEDLAGTNSELVSKWDTADLSREYAPLYDGLVGKLKILGTFIKPVVQPILVKEFQLKRVNMELTPNTRKLIMLNSAAKSTSKVQGRRKLFQGARLGDDRKLKRLGLDARLQKKKLADARTFRGKLKKGVMTAFKFIGIGYEVFLLGQKIKECVDIMKHVVQKEKDIKEDFRNVNIVKEKIDEGLEEISEGYEKVKDNLKSKSFIELIEGMRTLIVESAREAQDAEAQQAHTNITEFIRFINTSNPSLTYTLQKKLIAGLKSIDFKYLCLAKKHEIIRRVSDRCKLGRGTLRDLYDEGAEEVELEKNCQNEAGVTYTTFLGVKSVIDQVESKENNYYTNCLLNDALTMGDICDKYKCLEFSVKILVTSDISTEEIEMVCSNHICVLEPLTNVEKDRVCALKASLPSSTAETLFPLFPKNKNKDDIREQFDKCP